MGMGGAKASAKAISYYEPCGSRLGEIDDRWSAGCENTG